MSGFVSRTLQASVAEVHGTGFPEVVRREVWFVQPTDAAVVLGSTQSLSTLDLAEVHRRGLGVVRRHSGGGAVVVDDDASLWFDVWVPADDPVFQSDIGRSAAWLGGVLADALASVGVDGTVVRADAIERDGPGRAWASLVCFAAVGAGEILVDGRKAVGISQRRTRSGARFQVMIPSAFDPGATAALFDLSPDEHRDLTARLLDGATALEVESTTLRTAIEESLGQH